MEVVSDLALRRTDATDIEPEETAVAGTAVELTIATTVEQVVTIRGIAGSSRPPEPVLGIVERPTEVAAACDCGESGKTSGSRLPV